MLQSSNGSYQLLKLYEIIHGFETNGTSIFAQKALDTFCKFLFILVSLHVNLFKFWEIYSTFSFSSLETMCEIFEKLPFKPLSANPIKWSNTLKQFVDKLPTNCLSVVDHFVKLVLKGLI